MALKDQMKMTTVHDGGVGLAAWLIAVAIVLAACFASWVLVSL